MQIIDTEAALDRVADPPLRPILAKYRELMDLAVIYIIEPGDTLQSLGDRRGRHFAEFEFIFRYPGGWFEAVFVNSDDGAGDIVLVPDSRSIEAELLNLCRLHAIPAEQKEASEH